MENISDSRKAKSTKQMHGECRFNKKNARTEKDHLSDLWWRLCWETCSFSLDLWKKSSCIFSVLVRCWQKLRPLNESDVSTSVRGTFDAFRTGKVAVSSRTRLHLLVFWASSFSRRTRLGWKHILPSFVCVWNTISEIYAFQKMYSFF